MGGACLFSMSCLAQRSGWPDGFVDPPAIDVSPNHEDVVNGRTSVSDFIADGRKLFKTVFNTADGVGRPFATGDSKPTIRQSPSELFNRIAGPDASSCADCHNQPIQGGSGGLASNVFVGAHRMDPPPLTIHASVTNERNTISIFGAAEIETLAREMSDDLQAIKSQALIEAGNVKHDVRAHLQSKQVDFGFLTAHANGSYDASEIQGVDMDLVVKPFGVKGVAVSIREFTNFALNQHHGIEPEERFGWVRTGVEDFDGDGKDGEFSLGQVSALVLYQASLPAPRRITYKEAAKQESALRGEAAFNEIGCASCHRPTMPLRGTWFLEPNPFNRPGSATPADVSGQIALPLQPQQSTGLYRDDQGQLFVAAFTDLKRHKICDSNDDFFCNEQIVQDFVPTDQFLTSKLWDAGSSAPYGHRGNVTTISEAIFHHSGEGRASKEAFGRLDRRRKLDIVYFLKSLQVIE